MEKQRLFWVLIYRNTRLINLCSRIYRVQRQTENSREWSMTVRNKKKSWRLIQFARKDPSQLAEFSSAFISDTCRIWPPCWRAARLEACGQRSTWWWEAPGPEGRSRGRRRPPGSACCTAAGSDQRRDRRRFFIKYHKNHFFFWERWDPASARVLAEGFGCYTRVVGLFFLHRQATKAWFDFVGNKSYIRKLDAILTFLW